MKSHFRFTITIGLVVVIGNGQSKSQELEQSREGVRWTAKKLVLTYALVRFVSTDPEGIKDRSRWSRSAPPVTRLKT